MAIIQADSPFPLFTDKGGDPLDGGFVYFGEPDLNPEESPKTVYYDAALAIATPQPLRTSNGYITRNGAPASIYSDGAFSMTVRDRNGALVFYSPSTFLPDTSGFVLSDRNQKDVATLLANTTLTYTLEQDGTVSQGDIVRTLAEGFSYEVAASDATDEHVTTAGGVKLYVLPATQGYEVDAFGAANDGSDTFTAIQKAWEVAIAANAPVVYGVGTYLHTAAIDVDLTVSVSLGSVRYTKLIGQGSEVTQIECSGTGGIIVTGAAATGVNTGDHRFEVEGVSFNQGAFASWDRTTGKAIRVTDMVGLSIVDVTVGGFLVAVDLEDVLVSSFTRCQFAYAGTGVVGIVNDYSNFNVVSFNNCAFIACWTKFADVKGSNIKFDTCTFEGLGLDNSGDKSDYLSRGLEISSGPDGYISGVIDNCYFENNKGECDVYIDGAVTGLSTIRHNNFNRGGVTRYTENNIILASGATGTEQHAVISENGFYSFGTYVPDAGRPKISVVNTSGFDNWYVRADRSNVGLFSGVDAYDLNDANVKNSFAVPRSRKGTYTPIIQGQTTAGAGTYTTQVGAYERIGDMVFFYAQVAITAHTGTGPILISLPDIAPDLAGTFPDPPISMMYSGPAYTSGNNPVGYVRTAQNTAASAGSIQLFFETPAGGFANIALSSATHDIYVSGFYRARVD